MKVYLVWKKTYSENEAPRFELIAICKNLETARIIQNDLMEKINVRHLAYTLSHMGVTE